MGDNNKYTLHGLIDDASGQINRLYMCKNECMQGYFKIIRQTPKILVFLKIFMLMVQVYFLLQKKIN